MTQDATLCAQLTTKKNPKVCFIGGGNMAKAILEGLCHSGYGAENLWVIDRNKEKCDYFSKKMNMCAQSSIDSLITDMDIIVLAVKPQSFSEVLPQIIPWIHKNATTPQLIISIAAGIQIETIEHILDKRAIIRAMPNTPSAIQLGATGLFANSLCQEFHKSWAADILGACGICHWVENESLISAVVALSGSGPAYFLYMIECMENAAISLGLEPSIARKLVLQTALGATTLASDAQKDRQAPRSPKQLRAQVTSRNGTTEQAILSFQSNHYEAIILQAMHACYDRDKSLSLELSKIIKKK